MLPFSARVRLHTQHDRGHLQRPPGQEDTRQVQSGRHGRRPQEAAGRADWLAEPQRTRPTRFLCRAHCERVCNGDGTFASRPTPLARNVFVRVVPTRRDTTREDPPSEVVHRLQGARTSSCDGVTASRARPGQRTRVVAARLRREPPASLANTQPPTRRAGPHHARGLRDSRRHGPGTLLQLSRRESRFHSQSHCRRFAHPATARCARGHGSTTARLTRLLSSTRHSRCSTQRKGRAAVRSSPRGASSTTVRARTVYSATAASHGPPDCHRYMPQLGSYTCCLSAWRMSARARLRLWALPCLTWPAAAALPHTGLARQAAHFRFPQLRRRGDSAQRVKRADHHTAVPTRCFASSSVAR